MNIWRLLALAVDSWQRKKKEVIGLVISDWLTVRTAFVLEVFNLKGRLLYATLTMMRMTNHPGVYRKYHAPFHLQHQYLTCIATAATLSCTSTSWTLRKIPSFQLSDATAPFYSYHHLSTASSSSSSNILESESKIKLLTLITTHRRNFQMSRWSAESLIDDGQISLSRTIVTHVHHY